MTDEKGQLHKIAGGGGGGSSTKVDTKLDKLSNNPVANSVLYNPTTFAENERQKSKNLLIAPYGSGSKTENGLTFTDNEDGSIHIQGTASATTYYTFVTSPKFVHLKNDVYSLSLRDANNQIVSSIRLELWHNGDRTTLQNGYGYITNTFVEADYNDIYMYVPKNTTLDVTVYPQLELGEITEWQEYNGEIVHKGDAPVAFAESERQKSKNLWAYGDVSGTLYKTIVLDNPLPAGTYTLSLSCTSTDTDSSQCLVTVVGESGTNIKHCYFLRNERIEKLIDAQEPIKKILFYASNGYANSSGDTFGFNDIQIETGAVMTGYQKHYGKIVHSSEVYPVGSIYMSVNNISPASFFGGVWEKIEDRFLLASGSSYLLGETGGSADAIVVSHRHQFTVRQNVAIGSYTSIPSMTVNSTNTTAQGNTTTVGEDGVGKNMPPYLVVNVWKRVAEEEI
jgi:hypothetical protein